MKKSLHDFREDIIKRMFGSIGHIPQGWSRLAIEGRRDTDRRLAMYDLPLNDEMNVLELGSNVGFLTSAIAEQVKFILGIEKDPSSMTISTDVADFFDIENIQIATEQVEKSEHIKPVYDLVLSCQMHHWVKMGFEDYIDHIVKAVAPKGYLFFESHDTRTIDRDYNNKVNLIMRKGFVALDSGSYTEWNKPQYYLPDAKYPSMIPRAFTLFKKRK